MGLVLGRLASAALGGALGLRRGTREQAEREGEPAEEERAGLRAKTGRRRFFFSFSFSFVSKPFSKSF